MLKHGYIEIAEEIYENTIYFKSVPLLSYTIKYPQFSSVKFRNTLSLMNHYYKEKAVKYKHHCEQILYKMAVDQFEFSMMNNFPFHKYESVMDYKITYAEKCHISLYFDEYEYTGGAHGNTLRSSDTWNLQTGKKIKLSSMSKNKNFFSAIIKEINQQIEEHLHEGTNQYYSDYRTLTAKAFNPENFYLIPGFFTIYYQPYDIAPYSRGIPEFNITYSGVGAKTPCCKR